MTCIFLQWFVYTHQIVSWGFYPNVIFVGLKAQLTYYIEPLTVLNNEITTLVTLARNDNNVLSCYFISDDDNNAIIYLLENSSILNILNCNA